MIKGSVSDSQKSVGQRVYLEKNKHGTLRYFGNTHFAHGLWCGIELDEGTGEHDGMIDNIRYFTCKKNYGIFISASELNIINNDSVRSDLKVSSLLRENCSSTEKHLIDSSIQNFELCNISVSGDSQYTSPKSSHQKNKSFTISKKCFAKQLSVINVGNIENVKNLKAVNFSHLNNEACLSKCENVSMVKQVFESASKENEVFSQEFEENHESDESSLGILSHLKDLDSCSSFCDNLMVCSDKFHVDLNTTVNLHNSIGDIKEWEMDFMDYNTDEFASSSAYIVQKISPSKSDEGPVCINTSTPKFSSTPKHETNYSYVIDETMLTTQNLSPGLHLSKEDAGNGKHLECALNKTKDISISSEYALPVITNTQACVANEKRDSSNSILNITCNIDKPLNANQILLSKTFDNHDPLCGEVCCLPVANEKLSLINKSNVQHLSLPDCNQFIQYVIPEETNVVTNNLKQENYITVFSENMLNVTCNILKPSDTSISLSENLDKYSEYVENIPSNILNTTTIYSKVEEHKIAKDYALPDLVNKCLVNTKKTSSNILNTTISYSKVTAEGNALSESLDERYSGNTKSSPSNILNTTTSYSKVTGEHKIAKDNALSDLNNKCLENMKKTSSNILNTTISYSKITGEGNALSESLDEKYSGNRKSSPSNILNTTTSHSKVTGENNVLSESLDDKYVENAIPSGILNTTMPYSKSTEEKFLENNTENLNITYEKIDLPLELEITTKVSQPSKIISKLNGNMKNSQIVSKGEIKRKCSGFGKITKKSVGSIVKTTANSELKNKNPRRNSVISSMCNSVSNTYKDMSVKCSVNGNDKKMSFVECHPEYVNNLNENMNDFTYIKPDFAGIKAEGITPISETKFKANHLLNNDVKFASLNLEVGKTVVKKPHSSMNFFYKKSSAESCEIPSFKTQKKVTFPEKRSLLFQNKTTQEPNGDFHAYDKTHLKKHTVFNNKADKEKKQKISRIPGKHIFSQKNAYTNITPTETNTGNSYNTHSPAMKQSSQQAVSKISVSRSHSASYRPIQKLNLGNTILLSGQQSSSQQTTQTMKPSSQQAVRKNSVSRSHSASYHPIQKPNLGNTILISGQQSSSQRTIQTLKPSNSKINSQNSSTLRKPLNWECGSSKKANLNAVPTLDHQNSREENTQNIAFKFVPKGTSHIPLSRIPSILQSNKKQAPEVISGLTPSRSESMSYKKKNQSKRN